MGKCCVGSDVPITELKFDQDANAFYANSGEDLRQSRQAISLKTFTDNQQQYKSSNFEFKPTFKELQLIIYLQAIIRGYQQRKRYKKLQIEEIEFNTSYFKYEELLETINYGVLYDENAPTIKKRIQYQCSEAVYDGEMKGGFRHGQGVMQWKDGTCYEGEWDQGYARGQGKFYFQNGDIYEGEWCNGKSNGFGKYITKDSAQFEGNWKNDLQYGQGTEIWPNGSKYVGNYSDGKKHGKGMYTWADGTYYDGFWVKGLMQGNGYHEWKDGKKYYGQWEQNCMHGFGYMIQKDGSTYDGQFQEDKKDGYGIYKWTDGRKYEGWWNENKQHGLGIFYNEVKQRIKYGLWENGQRLSWYNEQMIQDIQRFSLSYDNEFEEQDSRNFLQPNATFDPPDDFTNRLNEIKQYFELN